MSSHKELLQRAKEIRARKFVKPLSRMNKDELREYIRRAEREYDFEVGDKPQHKVEKDLKKARKPLSRRPKRKKVKPKIPIQTTKPFVIDKASLSPKALERMERRRRRRAKQEVGEPTPPPTPSSSPKSKKYTEAELKKMPPQARGNTLNLSLIAKRLGIRVSKPNSKTRKTKATLIKEILKKQK